MERAVCRPIIFCDIQVKTGDFITFLLKKGKCACVCLALVVKYPGILGSCAQSIFKSFIVKVLM